MKYNKKVVEKIDSKQWKCVCCVKVYSNETKKSEHQKTQKHQISYAQYKREEDEKDKIAYEQRQKDRMEYLKKNNLI
tara:strand:- start:470 stop:700 length:231 start_codon:yes stop_codon:yes gene_type:complete